jgi:RimJ/RimL family protein N-acetyltransferase
MLAKSVETERLRLDRWAPEHSSLLVRLAAAPTVMRYIGRGTTWSRAEAEKVAQAQCDHWTEHGFGWRAAVERAGGPEVGFVALSFAGEGTAGLDPREYELGWWLDPAAWGRGFASEGGEAMVEEAFSRLAAPTVVARMQPQNLASIRVAEALGLSFDFETTGRTGEPLVVYRLARSASHSRWASASASAS